MRGKIFKVGSFNLYNLVLPEVKYYGRKKYTKKVYEKKKTWIAQKLDLMDADIIGFQEIFHEKALKEVLKESDHYKKVSVKVAKPTGKGPVVGLVSRFPIVEHEVIEDFPASALLDVDGKEIPLTRFSRPVLSARLKIKDNLKLDVFVVHLKSKRPMYADGADHNDLIEKAKGQARSLILRAAESTAMRSLLMDYLQGRNYPVIVLGDVNDAGLAVTSQIVSGEPPWRRLSYRSKKKIWDVLLYHVKDIQARQSYSDVYYTHIYNGHYESLDHIMVSQEFVDKNPNHIGRVGYFSVFNDHLIDETLSKGEVEKWQSDHGLVVASIEL
ncbi:MAG: Endonuclease/Exonuclease/phosphatase family protein [Candidatus Scalindua rubra]|uniref:Endonuclease/Exonuclease/phosphatase family protein n=1 Tax=Candidatus Scalindua rubra TaxID=1872076 RepID=A0A1E3XCK7_9BACT|nr:MAG: Endonuclease/Exonuclease/phosphatase family protein [Candidatus Scalindua rubra]